MKTVAMCGSRPSIKDELNLEQRNLCVWYGGEYAVCMVLITGIINFFTGDEDRATASRTLIGAAKREVSRNIALTPNIRLMLISGCRKTMVATAKSLDQTPSDTARLLSVSTAYYLLVKIRSEENNTAA